jgi:hypothetical protein
MEMHLWFWVYIYALTKIRFQNMKKIPNNRAYINILYVRTTKYRRKPIFLVLCVKKVKIMSRVNPYFSMNFCLFT